MDQDPEVQGDKMPKSTTETAKNDPGKQAPTLENNTSQTTVVETVTMGTAEPAASDRPMATEVITETTTETIGEPAAPKKKPRKGLIGLIITLVVLILVAAGAAAWYFIYYNNPDKVAYDAIHGFLQQKTVVTEGVIKGRGQVGDNEVSITVGLNNKSKGTLSGESIVSLKALILDANGEPVTDKEYEIELGGIIMSDGVMYLRTGKVMETVDTLLEDISTTTDELDVTYQTVYKILNNIDGEWWQISVPDIIDGVVDDSHVASSAKEFYGCIVNVAQEDVKDQIANLYSDHRFVEISKSKESSTAGSTMYDVDLNYDQLASFMNLSLETDAAKSTQNCLQKFVVDDLGGNLSTTKTETNADQLRQIFGDIDFRLAISDFSHELEKAEFTTKNDQGELNGEFGFTHPEVNIEAPEKYRPINELIEMILEAIMEANGTTDGEINDNAKLEYDETTGQWYFVDEGNIDDSEEI